MDLLRFIEQQIVFTMKSTENVKTYMDFMDTMQAAILFNSTCMCLQSIGETIKQVDERTEGELLKLYPNTPWKQIKAMRNIISHEYLSIDPELILNVVKDELEPLLADVRCILSDIDAGLRDEIIKG